MNRILICLIFLPFISFSQIEKDSVPTVYDHWLTVKDTVLFAPKNIIKTLSFSENLSPLYVEDSVKGWKKAGFINKSGKFVIFPQYDSVYSGFFGGAAVVGDFSPYPIIQKKVITPKNVVLNFGDSISDVASNDYGLLWIRNRNNKWGAFKKTGEKILDFNFDSIWFTKNKNIIASENQYQKIISKEGNLISNDNYKSINEIAPDTFQVNLYSVIDLKNVHGELLSTFNADSVTFFSDGLIGKWLNGKVFIFHLNNIEQVKLIDDIFQSPKKNLFYTKVENKLGLIDTNGTQVFSNTFQDFKFNNGFIFGEENQRLSLYSVTGKKYFTSFFKEISFPVDSLIAARSWENKWGVINLEGDTILDFIYPDLKLLSGKKIYVTSLECDGAQIIDTSGAVTHSTEQCFHIEKGLINVDPFRYDSIFSFGNQTFITKRKNKYGVINSNGQELFPAINDSVIFEKESEMFIVYYKDSIGLANEYGEAIMQFRGGIYKLYPFHNGMSKFVKEGKFGYLDTLGNIAISPQYDSIGIYANGFVPVVINGKWAYLNNQEEIVAQPHYDELKPFQDSVGIGRIGKGWRFISRSGKPVNSFIYDSIVVFPRTKKFIVYRKGSAGLADVNGREMMGPKYESISDLGNGYVIAEKYGKYGLLDYQETFILPFESEYLEGYKNLLLFFRLPKQEVLIIPSTSGKRKGGKK